MRPFHWEPRHHEWCCYLPSRVRGAAEPLPWLQSPICGAQLSRPFRRKSHARRLAICIPFILPYLTSAGLCWRSSAEGNDDDTAMSSVRDVLSALSPAPRSPPVEAIIYWGTGVDPRVWGGQMPDEGSAATELEMEATENHIGRAKLARFLPGWGGRGDEQMDLC